jgi:predicted alpha-1,2-mannosidase
MIFIKKNFQLTQNHKSIKPMKILLLPLLFLTACSVAENPGLTKYVNPFIGTGGNGQIAPVASVPSGMVQVGPDTDLNGVGYHYDQSRIMGFSHIHKSGGGCGDFQDILFQPTVGETGFQSGSEDSLKHGYSSAFSHETETAKPGYYSVLLADYNIRASLTATLHGAIHEYSFPQSDSSHIIIDLHHSNQGSCTIHAADNYDTVTASGIKIISPTTIQGYRISSGWAKNQQVYFYAEFSKAFISSSLWEKGDITLGKTEAAGTDLRLCLDYKTDVEEKIYAWVGISAVSCEQAKKNLDMEITGKSFEEIKESAETAWNRELGKIEIEGGTDKQKEIFYTSLFHTLMYPMLSSDADGSYRGADNKIYKADNYKHYSGVVGLWDTFRAANPLLTILKPEVANDYIRTFLSHYEQTGLLPIWVLYGNETLTMIGYHAMPVIADTYYKGIRNYDAKKVFDAMKASAEKDTFGFSMRQFTGTKNYKKYNYVPADLESESVAKTLEYSYDDWCIAQMALQLGETKDYEHFIKRAGSYKNLYDSSTNFMRGKLSNGNWNSPFNPLASNHRRDDYCEGNAWQWTFFVPHDITGLSKLMGGPEKLAARLDSLFINNQDLSGTNVSGDISGLIGQYAHGNEPSHHIAYMYDYVGQPWKTQKLVNQIMNTMYDITPEGICGNDDTGQMSAWYIFSAMGFYPVTHGNGVYALGAPCFPKMTVVTGTSEKPFKLEIIAKNLSSKNIYVQKVLLNGTELDANWVDHYQIFGRNASLVFEMGNTPDYLRGTDASAFPPSLSTY